jgi:2,3-bisphosphoglycerate-independent phosphoglycerate mutase
MHILFLFLDGIGLGLDDVTINPFAAAHLPTLHQFTHGQRWLADVGKRVTERALFIPTDAQLGMEGAPQSGSSQAAILTGKNVPQIIGEHYGPKPNAPTREIIAEDNIFKQVRERGKTSALLDAYPPTLLASIARGKTLPSSIQQAALNGGQTLFTKDDLIAGRALTPEWTGHAWREHLKLNDTPVYTPYEAGQHLARISRSYDFAFHSHWMTDYVGHRGPLSEGVNLLETFDGVMAGLLDAWDDEEGLILMTSDHGNLEDIDNRHHTENLVPTLVIGAQKEAFAEGFTNLTDFYPRIVRMLFNS